MTAAPRRSSCVAQRQSERKLPRMTQTQTLFNGQWLRLRKRGRWEFAERTNPGGGVIIVALTPQDHPAGRPGPGVTMARFPEPPRSPRWSM